MRTLNILRFLVVLLCMNYAVLQAANAQDAPGRQRGGEASSLVDRQQAAIDEARRMLSSPVAVTVASADSESPSVRGPSVAAILFWSLLPLLLLGGAIYLLFKSQRPDLPPAVDLGSDEDDARVRTVLGRVDDGRSFFSGVSEANAKNSRFMELAVKNQFITAAERDSLSRRFEGNDFGIMLFLIEQRPHVENAVAKLWGDSIGLAYTDPTKTILDHELVGRLPKNFGWEHSVIPLYAVDSVITVAMADPGNASLQRDVETHLNALVSPVFALPCHIAAALEIAQVSLRALKDQLSGKLASAAQEGAKIARLAEKESVAEFVRGLFLLALKQHASDIHIEPRESDISIRFRIDGALQEYLLLPMELFPSLSNVVKIMAEVDIGERRRPQDGRITMKMPDRDIEFRFSCVPTIYGEKIVLRLLGQNQLSAVPGLEDLSFSKPILDGIRQIIDSPNGVFFVTGPTGSGKTTTLYAALKALNRKDLNIMTIEDPVEYRLPGINQVQVNAAAGVTFASALRSFLRQDPDVILVGEIRDLETAKIASQAALTGHLVLTTMHTNNALQAVTRLIQIGVEPFLVAPSIIGVMAQRLVRRLCDVCKEKYELTPEEMDKYFEWDGKTTVSFYRKKGCQECNYSGYSGRVAIHELFIIDDEMRGYIARNSTILDIQKYAIEAGFSTMRFDGIKKVIMGLTTVEEVNHVILAS